MHTEWTITPAEPADAEWMSGLESACFSEPWSKSALLDAMANDAYICIKAVCGERRAGYALFQNICGEGYICSIAVFETMRRNGAATALLRAMKTYTDRNLRFLTLEVRPSNKAAVALYEKEGFCQTGRRRNFYRKPTEDALLMTYTPQPCEKHHGETD